MALCAFLQLNIHTVSFDVQFVWIEEQSGLLVCRFWTATKDCTCWCLGSNSTGSYLFRTILLKGRNQMVFMTVSLMALEHLHSSVDPDPETVQCFASVTRVRNGAKIIQRNFVCMQQQTYNTITVAEWKRLDEPQACTVSLIWLKLNQERNRLRCEVYLPTF